jgi:hypothetical protein
MACNGAGEPLFVDDGDREPQGPGEGLGSLHRTQVGRDDDGG